MRKQTLGIQASGFFVGLAAVCALSIGLGACDMLGLDPGSGTEDDDNTTYASNVVLVDGDIVEASTWTSGKVYYLNDSIAVRNGATLSLAAGTIVKFGSDGALVVEGGGRIVATGTEDSPIIFTSFRDSSAGGDSILTDAATAPARGDWNYVWVQGGSTANQFVQCEFRYAGKAENAALDLSGSGTVDRCLFRDNLGGNPRDGNEAALQAISAESGSSITNTLFYGNVWPLSLSASMSLDGSNRFSFDDDENPATPDRANDYQGIYLEDASISASVSLEETELPFCVFGDTLWVESSGTFSLASGLVMKFSGPGAGIEIGEGGVMNYEDALFTSYRDDAALGDTNADGTASTPVDGDWAGIYDAGASDYLPRDDAAGPIKYSNYTTGD